MIPNLSELNPYICFIVNDMKKLILIGSICSALAVMIGAFGAHALKPLMNANELQTFETGVKYHFIHSLGILLIGILYFINPNKLLIRAGYFLTFGILFFSFSLYLLALKQSLGIASWTFLGPITPLGGLCFIIGWGLTFWSFLKYKHD